jgi:Sec-independent protein secretion pathway components
MLQSLPLAFISMPGGLEWVVIGLVALLIFGKRLPGVARSLGQALHEFKSGFSGQGEEKKDGDNPASKDTAKTESKTDGNES